MAEQMLTLKDYLSKNKIEFSTYSKAVRWAKSLKPKALVRIGTSHFVNELEMNELLLKYIGKKKRLRQTQKENAKQLNARKKAPSIPKKPSSV